MDAIYTSQFVEWLQGFDFFILLMGVFGIATYIFWREAKGVGKLRNDIFDGWIFSSTVTIVWGRVAYVISNWDSFAQSYWFYLPYERYANEVYLFRAMPWKLITIWDGGFLFTGMLVGFLAASMVFNIWYKKWPVRDMLATVSIVQFFMLGATLFLYGAVAGVQDVANAGIALVVSAVVMKYVLALVSWFGRKKEYGDRIRLVSSILQYMYLVLGSVYIWQIFFAEKLTSIDRGNLYVYAGLAAIFLLLSILDVNRNYGGVPTGGKKLHTQVPVRNQAIKGGMFES